MAQIDKHDFLRAVLLLDGSQDALEAAAKREKRREAGKTLRRITDQRRAETVRDFVAKMDARYGLGLTPAPAGDE